MKHITQYKIAVCILTICPFFFCGFLAPAGAARQDIVKQLLQEGFDACKARNFETAQAKWADAIGILKEQHDTDKEQADQLVLMGNALKRYRQDIPAMNMFSHALSLYQNVADISGQELCIKEIEKISPKTISVLGKSIKTVATPPEDRVKLDKNGHLLPLRTLKGEEKAKFDRAYEEYLDQTIETLDARNRERSGKNWDIDLADVDHTDQEKKRMKIAIMEYLESLTNAAEAVPPASKYEKDFSENPVDADFLSTPCYDVLSSSETLKKYPDTKYFLALANRNKASLEKIFADFLSKLQTLKQEFSNDSQQDQRDSMNLLIQEVSFVRDVALTKIILSSRTTPTPIFAQPSPHFFTTFLNGLAQHGVSWSKCGMFDGYGSNMQSLKDEDWWKHSTITVVTEGRGIQRVTEGRWKGAFQIESGTIFLPGLKCFSKEEPSMRIEMGNSGMSFPLP